MTGVRRLRNTKGGGMAHVNYQFEKRKRDLEKKQKQEAKRLRKLEKRNARAGEAAAQPPSA